MFADVSGLGTHSSFTSISECCWMSSDLGNSKFVLLLPLCVADVSDLGTQSSFTSISECC